jgi:hypothetical protein
MIPEDALDQIRRWADRRLPEHARVEFPRLDGHP